MNLNVKFMISDIPTSAWRPAGNAETDLCVAILRDSAGCAFWNLYSEKDSGAEALVIGLILLSKVFL